MEKIYQKQHLDKEPKDDLENPNVFDREETIIETELKPEELERVSSIKKKFDEKFTEKSFEQKVKVMDEISEYIKIIKQNYGEAVKDYALFHVIVFSTMDTTLIKHVDFPEPDSIEKFIDEL